MAMIHVLITGDVQGVGFRQYVKYQAKKLNVKGWVKNLPDGKVEGCFSGSEENLERMINFSKRGPVLARVEDVKINELPDENFEDFQIIKD